MLRKDTISEDSVIPYSNMDVYLTSPQSNISVIPPQKSINQIASTPQPNYNFMGNKQMESMRAKQCSMRQIIPNQAHLSNGIICNRPLYNGNPPTNNGPDGLTINHLYQIAENFYPIDKLTLPVNNGQLYGPFTLPNNQMITEIEFHLKEESLTEIVNREDLDIVLLSRLTNTFNLLVWPSSICISVNETPVTLDMKNFNRIPVHLPLYIKNSCAVGRNVVKFEIFDLAKFNPSMYQFNIYMVHRPTIAHARESALANAFVSEDLTFKLIHENCSQNERDHVNIATFCSITGKRIEIPARLKCCAHLQPFDLVGFLKIQARWMLTTCPLCYQSLPFNFNGLQQNIVIDRILQFILDRNHGFDYVKINLNGSYAPIPNPHPGMEFNQIIRHNNNMMMPARHGLPHFSEINGNPLVHQSQPLPPVYRPSDQSMNFQMINGAQHRIINTPLNSIPIDSRSMLDLHQQDDQSILVSMQSNMKYPHQTLPYANEKTLVKKPAKRKLPRKATPKSKVDSNSNLVNTTNLVSNGALTPPSTRTSSVASTSSPDSLNVPHLNLKRPPSNDLLPSTIQSECLLSTVDDMTSFSTSVSQMNNLSFNPQTQFHHQQQQQQPQHFHHLYQLPPEHKCLSNWSVPEQMIIQQQHQRQMQQQQHQPNLQSQIQHQQEQHQPDQQQFNINLSVSTPSFYQSQNSYPGSVKQEPIHYPNSVKHDSMYYPPSVKQESQLYPPSVKQDSQHYPPSVKQESQLYPPSVKQETQHYPPSVKQESQYYPPEKNEPLHYTQIYPQPSNICSDNTNNLFTQQQLSNSSCSSSISSFIEHILSTHEPVPDVDECPWLGGFDLISMKESVNLSDMEEF